VLLKVLYRKQAAEVTGVRFGSDLIGFLHVSQVAVIDY
jgi:hypothetical protein